MLRESLFLVKYFCNLKLLLTLIGRAILLPRFSFSVSSSSWWHWVCTLLRKAWEIICTARWPLCSSAISPFASSLPSYPGLRSVPNPKQSFQQDSPLCCCCLMLPYALPLLLPLLPYIYLSKVTERGGAGCILSGYLIQYFFLAFFSTLNAIALNIYLPFSMFSSSYQKVRWSCAHVLIVFPAFSKTVSFSIKSSLSTPLSWSSGSSSSWFSKHSYYWMIYHYP